MLRTVERLAQAIVTHRWDDAMRRDAGGDADAMRAYRGKWEGPGFVCFSPDTHTPTLIFFMAAAARARWKAQCVTQKEQQRSQDFAPPDALPDGTISIFTDGSAQTTRPDQPPLPAGYGAAAVHKGVGHEHTNGVEIFTISGQINARDPGVVLTKNANISNNVAELLAFTKGLRWARTHPSAAGRAIVMRYDSKYAALVSAGTWKAKKNRVLALQAQREWKLTAIAKRGQLWMRHVKGHSGHVWNDRADALADAGRFGADRWEAPPEVVD